MNNFGASVRAIWVMTWACLSAATARADAPLEYSTIEPKQIVMGEAARLTITSLGAGMQPYRLPTVSGLQFEVLGERRQIEMTNGTTLASTAVIIRVTPQIPGIFSIPPITPNSQPLILEVLPNRAAANAARPVLPGAPARPPPPPPIKAPESSNPDASGIRMTPDGSAFARVTVPKRPVYVGEDVPVEVELGVREGYVTNLHGMPTLTGNEFTFNNISGQPESREQIIDGKRFQIFSWHSVVAAVKPGDFSLSVEEPIRVKIRTEPQRESRIDDMLGDPFFQNLFGATVMKDITVTSPSADLKVMALPADGRPADFSGAVGVFKVASEVSAATAAVGDPITLKMHVSGEGNFDRVDSPMLQSADPWKAYSPKSNFVPSGSNKSKGEKTFEQSLIASSPGTQTVPGLAFSYFDPVAHRYETAHSTPINVTITSATDSRLAAFNDPAAGSGAADGVAVHGLRPDHDVESAASGSLLPLYFQERFMIVPSLLTLAFTGAWLTLRRRAAGSGPHLGVHAAIDTKANRLLLARMEQAAQAKNAAAFFDAAQALMQQGAGGGVEELLALANEAEYSGRRPTAGDFSRWSQWVRQQLSSVEPA